VLAAAIQVVSSFMNQYLTEKVVAERLSLSIAALRRWRRSGFGPPWVRLSVAIRYEEAGLEAWLAKQPNHHAQ
jgi:hypothetical protein